MNFLKKLFGAAPDAAPQAPPITSYADFWRWFRQHADQLAQVVKTKDQTTIVKGFVEVVGPQLDQLGPGYYFLTGMADEQTADLVLTADGSLKHIAAVEALAAAAPPIPGWQVTSLKPPLGHADFSLAMHGFAFEQEKIWFYGEEHPDYPDEIDITLVHENYTDEHRDAIAQGTCLFVENLIGELKFATLLDRIDFTAPAQATQPLVPIAKLDAYLTWRQKEFVEKYEGTRYNTANDQYAAMQGEVAEGKPLIAVINTTLLEWDAQASHPWVLVAILGYPPANEAGMADQASLVLLEAVEDELLDQLTDFDGYLNLGRQTANGEREIYFACKDFRKPGLVLPPIVQKYQGKLAIDFEIYKDKYWSSFARFRNAPVADDDEEDGDEDE
ncbi:MAG: DUF695 domain-containing protein [Bernardetiaceae bacterium]|jgi:hypothetical protein|nr:DUF695 domain-containing protein [Bernardetiaceae bacterium]